MLSPTTTSPAEAVGVAQASNARKFYVLFFLSGFPALLYQIVWQRALFTIYGVNIESVTVIVTVFMLGLGLGSLAGGWVSKRADIPLLGLFGAIELGIAVFGCVSMRLFHGVASLTAGAGALQTGLVTFFLLMIPTLLMGSTLPLLVAHLARRNGNVGESVGGLYAANTFGSAAACFLAAHLLMGAFGESGCVRFAALINASVAATAFLMYFRDREHAAGFVSRQDSKPRSWAGAMLPFGVCLLVAGGVGFISLGYEIVWYRLYSFAAGRTASCFALLLAWYLAGIAYGSLAVRDQCRRRLRADPAGLLRATASVIIWANIAAFLVGPALAAAVAHVPIDFTYPFVFVGAALLGAAFPLLAHAAIDPSRPDAGARLSYLYLSNILGCASGSLIVGFVLFDRISTRGVSTALLLIGMGLGGGLLFAAGRKALTRRRSIGFALGAIPILAAWPLYSNLYERLLFKSEYATQPSFQHLVETRSGVIAVAANGTVFGGGVYDGRLSTDLVNDSNSIFRAFAVAAFHPDPQQVLMVGLSSGSWAQAIANNPRVAELTIVEINPGYLTIIPKHPMVASLLRNPKVKIVIDDGRRWLVRNPDRKFDVVVMNTPQHWLAHVSNLLSVEFLGLVRSHLKPGGIHYYNTTSSPEALLTGSTVFPYALRISNFLAVSDSPFTFDKERWRTALAAYRIDNKAVLDLGREADRGRLDELLHLADTLHDEDFNEPMRIEGGDSIRRRFRDARLITDDNMGSEWR